MARYLELEISLRWIEPRIWRRILIRRSASFEDLHRAIQDACGWEDYHLWEFRKPGRRGERIGGPVMDDDGLWDPPPDAGRVKLSTRFSRKGSRCDYLYDFGDGWVHEVKMRGTQDLPEQFTRRLLAGRRAFPPEDCGGIGGYYHCLAALGKVDYAPDSPEVPDEECMEQLREWLGGEWDPEGFDLKATRAVFDR